MSNFPYNNDKYEYKEDVNGSPMTFYELMGLADKILYWHTHNDTADFSQSSDGFDNSCRYLAFGLLELLSDPNAIKRLETTGREVEREISLILSSKNGVIERWDTKIKPMLREVFRGYL